MMIEDEFFNIITENVKVERKKRKVSQLALALMLDHQSPSYVARIELREGNANYNLHHLFIIANEFNIDIHSLLPSTRNSIDN